MNVSKEELLTGKATIIKGKQYLQTQNYVIPFFNKMEPIAKEFKITVKTPDQITIGNEADITFNRVLIQSKTEREIQGLCENIFFVYGIDVKKPVAKFYKAYTDDLNNLFIFNPNFQNVQPLEENEPITHNVRSLLELTDDTENYINYLHQTMISVEPENVEKLLGKWIQRCLYLENNSDYGKVKLSPNIAIDVYKMLFADRTSEYHIGSEVSEISMYHVYNTFSHVISNDSKDIMNKFEKILLIKDVIR